MVRSAWRRHGVEAARHCRWRRCRPVRSAIRSLRLRSGYRVDARMPGHVPDCERPRRRCGYPVCLWRARSERPGRSLLHPGCRYELGPCEFSAYRSSGSTPGSRLEARNSGLDLEVVIAESDEQVYACPRTKSRFKSGRQANNPRTREYRGIPTPSGILRSVDGGSVGIVVDRSLPQPPHTNESNRWRCGQLAWTGWFVCTCDRGVLDAQD